ncbi:putative radical SAM protein YgiQ [Natranaerovirga hydrolytica]|uniref:Putative radical SAM protein YgiQ n=1 Tax=Natranaerovirga hydrolytica TaxID=680378 RepID=A0A4R1N2P1_9FIRM|nr:YgiQ family radical SAM protein [Natranaerovirga hydrolytica]TCK98274.1 putative radical SAM protein YgiQ [Natranaerovirga hydrolytica]
MKLDFLPVNKEEMKKREWEQVDFALITGDAYIDHPSFGTAIISRILEANGYKVGIIPQPRWQTTEDIEVFGKPRLGFLVTAGNIDSMVNHYSVAKKRRNKDAYSPNGATDKRPDRATIVYCNLIKQKYKDVPIIIGGIEASLRRLAHYDYWDNQVRRSILLDSQADLLLYGMSEKAIIEVADALNNGIDIKHITYVDGTVYKTGEIESVYDYITLPDYNAIKKGKQSYAQSFLNQYNNTDPFTAKRLVEPYKDNEFIVQNMPTKPLSESELDRIYSLPYVREPHPMYETLGKIPAIEEVKFSLISNRGCFGSCNFCALTYHQGRIIQSRSHDSLVREAEMITWDKDFKGYIHDVGGPTANFRQPACDKQLKSGACSHKQCLTPNPCERLNTDHSDYVNLLKKLRNLPNVKKVFVRSGIRFDYLLKDSDGAFFDELVQHHISGQLKVAPEHISNRVLEKMGKPRNEVYKKFVDKYNKVNEKYNKNQFLVPYLMSSHPGSTLEDAIELAEYLRDIHYMPEQVQDFYPTPSTLSTCMYYTELDPRTMESVYVPKSPHEKAMQRALIQYKHPRNYHLVYEALKKAGREDLIGFDKKCLIRPKKGEQKKPYQQHSNEPKTKPKKKKTIRNVHKKKK